MFLCRVKYVGSWYINDGGGIFNYIFFFLFIGIIVVCSVGVFEIFCCVFFLLKCSMEIKCEVRRVVI